MKTVALADRFTFNNPKVVIDSVVRTQARSGMYNGYRMLVYVTDQRGDIFEVVVTGKTQCGIEWLLERIHWDVTYARIGEYVRGGYGAADYVVTAKA